VLGKAGTHNQQAVIVADAPAERLYVGGGSELHISYTGARAFFFSTLQRYCKPRGEQNKLVYFLFRRREKSVGCDDRNFSFSKECDNVTLSVYLLGVAIKVQKASE